MNTLTALAWRTSVILLLLFISYVYAGSLEEEAKKEIMDFYFNKGLITKCDSNLYSYRGVNNPQALEWIIVEVKEWSTEVKSDLLNAADKLKGIEWKGSGELRPKTWRMYQENRGWSSWQPTPHNESGRVFLGKKRGKWIVIPNGSLEKMMQFVKPIDCKKLATIPKPK
jgi:hypothetical protein